MLAYRDGEAAAFEALYARWRGPLYRYFLRQCGHAGQADELFQDVFLRVIGAAAGYEASAKFTTWLFRIAHNRLVDHWRKTGREPVDSLASGARTARIASSIRRRRRATPPSARPSRGNSGRR